MSNLFEQVFNKLALITFFQLLISVFKNSSTRLLMRRYLSSTELPMSQWYKLDFWLHLKPMGFFAITAIASFTAITFPLGMWESSFEVSKSYPIRKLIVSMLNLVIFPINFFVMKNGLGEMAWNTDVKIGFVGFMLSFLLMGGGAYFMWRGNL